MAWKIVRYCELDILMKDKVWLQEVMRLLRDQGANCDWVEPDGLVVNEAEIDRLCSMTKEQLEAQYHPRFKYPNWYTWEALTDEERLEAEARRDKYLLRRGL